MQLHAEREVLHLNLGYGTEKHEPFESMTATGKLHAGIMWQQLPACKQIMYQCLLLAVVTCDVSRHLARRTVLIQVAVAKQPRCWFGLDRMSAVARTQVSLDTNVRLDVFTKLRLNTAFALSKTSSSRCRCWQWTCRTMARPTASLTSFSLTTGRVATT